MVFVEDPDLVTEHCSCREVAASDLSIDKLLKAVEDAGSLSLSDERISITFLSSLLNPSRLPSGDSLRHAS